MRITNRTQQLLIDRLVEYLPEFLPWNQANVQCHIENIDFSPANGLKSNWRQTAEFTGQMQVELVVENIEQAVTEPLIDSLLNNPLMLQPEGTTTVGELSEQVRFELKQWRNKLKQVAGIETLIAAFTLELSGSLVRKVGSPTVIAARISRAPAIGIEHEEDYTSVAEYLQEQNN